MARIRSAYRPVCSFAAGNRYRPWSSLTTVIVIVESDFLALTSTPSIEPSSADVTCPVSATEGWFSAVPKLTAILMAIASNKIRFRITASSFTVASRLYFPSTDNARRTLSGTLRKKKSEAKTRRPIPSILRSRRKQKRIDSCQRCYQEDAKIPFDWILAEVPLVRTGGLSLETAQVCQFAQREDTLDTPVFDDPGRVICDALVAARNSYGRV